MCHCTDDNICAFHADRDSLITDINTTINNSIGPAVSLHQGYWKFFFWVAGITATVMLATTFSILASVTATSDSIGKLERIVESQVLRNEFINQRLDNQRGYVFEIRDRVRALEIGHAE